MTLTYEIDNMSSKWRKRVEQAVNTMEECFNSEEFRQIVMDVAEWDYTDNDSEQIIKDVILRDYDLTLYGFAYSKLDPRYLIYRKTRAESQHEADYIRVNLRHPSNKNPLKLAGTIAHELCHITDQCGTDHGYSHGDNDSYGKEDSVPYKIGSLVRTFKDNG